MSLFLNIQPLEDVRATIRSIAPEMDVASVPLTEAYDRILAAPITADADIPPFARSVVDGYAVVAADTTGASESVPAMVAFRGRVGMGEMPAVPVSPGECLYVPTGGVLPEGADAMVMVEDCEQIGDEVLVTRPVAPGENIIQRGEDFSAGQVVLEAGRRLSPRDLGVLAALGRGEVAVRMRPVVGIISTGNELVPVSQTPGPGQIRDVNSSLCSAFIQERGGRPVFYGIVRDERELLAKTLNTARAECDLILISGGSSKDERDVCASVIESTGEVLVHGIAIAPGKPTIIGKSGHVPIIGLPGHPASAFVVLIAIVGELIAAMTGEERILSTTSAVLASPVASAKGRDDYVRVTIRDGTAEPVFGKSGLLNTLVASSGLIVVPANREGLDAGEQVEVILW